MKRWSVGLAIAAVVLGLAGWATAAKFRFDQWVPEPFAGLDRTQWDSLLSGLVGAALGGLVAVVVLHLTLRSQRQQFDDSEAKRHDEHRESLKAQQDALDAQLKAARDALAAQIAASAREAAKQREFAARAELIVVIQEMLQTRHEDSDARFALTARISNGIEKLRFELHGPDDQVLWTELDHWRGVFAEILGRMYVFPDPRKHSSADEYLLGAAGALLINSLVEFRRNFDGKNWTASEITRVLREFREKTLEASRTEATEGPAIPERPA